MEIKNVPHHVAIIMDGNGRWAKKNHRPRIQGHMEGVRRAEEIIKESSRLGIKYLTLFAFSTENWKRPREEVSALMRLLCNVLTQKTKGMIANDVRIRFVGRRRGIAGEVLKSIDKAEQSTLGSKGLNVVIAFNYGARQEILDAVQDIVQDVVKNKVDLSNLNEDIFRGYLYTKDLPDPDLLIRTSGEMRISNFLLWQLSYAEFYFTDKFWPEFNIEELHKALVAFSQRERRFGLVTAVKHP